MQEQYENDLCKYFNNSKNKTKVARILAEMKTMSIDISNDLVFPTLDEVKCEDKKKTKALIKENRRKLMEYMRSRGRKALEDSEEVLTSFSDATSGSDSNSISKNEKNDFDTNDKSEIVENERQTILAVNNEIKEESLGNDNSTKNEKHVTFNVNNISYLEMQTSYSGEESMIVKEKKEDKIDNINVSEKEDFFIDKDYKDIIVSDLNNKETFTDKNEDNENISVNDNVFKDDLIEKDTLKEEETAENKEMKKSKYLLFLKNDTTPKETYLIKNDKIIKKESNEKFKEENKNINVKKSADKINRIEKFTPSVKKKSSNYNINNNIINNKGNFEIINESNLKGKSVKEIAKEMSQKYKNTIEPLPQQVVIITNKKIEEQNTHVKENIIIKNNKVINEEKNEVIVIKKEEVFIDMNKEENIVDLKEEEAIIDMKKEEDPHIEKEENLLTDNKVINKDKEEMKEKVIVVKREEEMIAEEKMEADKIKKEDDVIKNKKESYIDIKLISEEKEKEDVIENKNDLINEEDKIEKVKFKLENEEDDILAKEKAKNEINDEIIQNNLIVEERNDSILNTRPRGLFERIMTFFGCWTLNNE